MEEEFYCSVKLHWKNVNNTKFLDTDCSKSKDLFEKNSVNQIKKVVHPNLGIYSIINFALHFTWKSSKCFNMYGTKFKRIVCMFLVCMCGKGFAELCFMHFLLMDLFHF